MGNGRVLALIGPDASVDWWCAPRFDSPSLFGGLLDREKGGSFSILPCNGLRSVERRYLVNTNVLRTVMTTDEGSFEILDFAPREAKGRMPDSPLELHRLVRPLEGTPRVRVRFDPRPDYGRARPVLIPTTAGIVCKGGDVPVWLGLNAPPTQVLAGQPLFVDRARVFVVSYGLDPGTVTSEESERLLKETVWWWRTWVKSCHLPGVADREVIRSALALRLHMFEDTGAIVAAATTSLPEALGTPRTWDYRYCWLRDAAFVVEAFKDLGLLVEGERFLNFLRDVAAEPGRLQPVYGVAGERNLEECVMEHWCGFAGNGPVRVGNAAFAQRQNDVYGEMIMALEPLLADPRLVREDRGTLFELVCRIVETAIEASREEDTGIWEFRTRLDAHTFSRAMCWTAVARGADLARLEGRGDLAARWREAASALRGDILRRAWNPDGAFFAQTLGGRDPDASNLLLARIGMVDPRDPRFVSTVRACERILVRDGLMLRYATEDDFGATTSAHLICSFWWAEALALMGETDRAMEVFEALLGHSNELGLFTEAVDPSSGLCLGNFPQAYTHVGVITTASAIARSRREETARKAAGA